MDACGLAAPTAQLGLAASRGTGGFEPVETVEELRGQRPCSVALRFEAAEHVQLGVAVADLAVDDGGLLVGTGSPMPCP